MAESNDEVHVGYGALTLKKEEERLLSTQHFGVHAQGARVPEILPPKFAPPEQSPYSRQPRSSRGRKDSRHGTPTKISRPPTRTLDSGGQNQQAKKQDLPDGNSQAAQNSENILAHAKSHAGHQETIEEGISLVFATNDTDVKFRSPRPTPPPSREGKLQPTDSSIQEEVLAIPGKSTEQTQEVETSLATVTTPQPPTREKDHWDSQPPTHEKDHEHDHVQVANSRNSISPEVHVRNQQHSPKQGTHGGLVQAYDGTRVHFPRITLAEACGGSEVIVWKNVRAAVCTCARCRLYTCAQMIVAETLVACQ